MTALACCAIITVYYLIKSMQYPDHFTKEDIEEFEKEYNAILDQDLVQMQLTLENFQPGDH